MRHLLLTLLVSHLLAASVVSAAAVAEDHRFEGDVKRFEEADARTAPEPGGVLFVGSSSIRMWKLDESFPERKTLNRGFGGSQISDQLHFFDRVVLPYKPDTIVFYCGDNDIGSGKSAEQVESDFRTFTDRVKKELPKAKLILIPIKPSIKRWNLWDKMNDANACMAAICAENKGWHVVDIVTPMLGDDGKPRPELFVNDGLHLSAKGYEVWTALVEAKLSEIQ